MRGTDEQSGIDEMAALCVFMLSKICFILQDIVSYLGSKLCHYCYYFWTDLYLIPKLLSRDFIESRDLKLFVDLGPNTNQRQLIIILFSTTLASVGWSTTLIQIEISQLLGRF